ncbi:UDP-N-acetylmuramoyl-tripeptide--D-alanyl-D-alanine ligase [uncultured Mailhella sp.]|uniref:UDP-N-acetylmuramoyl-tripeptide--D-alanyl-D- alanine ligase n=1 Tax=uncultured Mailhella sp. TaxID=1981031 RepID=UPI00261F53FD|nr:UDP-N-acetylmuramoyl-tripeptide--D-alanyl-D-alanine ligase [uncultured Mailhella sp.]
MTLEHAARAAHAEILRPAEVTLTGAASDNRTVRPGQLFVAIPGEKTDGHLFAAAAVQAGASAVLAEHDPFAGKPPVPVLLVQNSVKALGLIAHDWRSSFQGKVVGLTGTAGKTTTKELLSSILSCRGKTARTALNLNTQVGMPVSMLEADGDESFWVMEAGISRPDDMDELGPILEPDLAVILNAGTGHSLGLGKKGTAYYKSKLLNYLKKGGIALVSADYEDLVSEAKALRPDTIFFSAFGRKAPYRAEYLGLDENGCSRCRLYLDGESFDVTCALSGAYAAENVLAAAATAHLLGLSRQEIIQGLEGASLPAQRFARHETGGWSVIDDSYNANPLSAGRMIEAAAELAGGRPFLCVMGAMAELGDKAEDEHRKLGQKLAASGCQAVFWTGEHAAEVQEGLETGAFSGHYAAFSGPEDFSAALEEWRAAYPHVLAGLALFKGSRRNRMERFVKLFMERVCHAV